MLLLMDWELGKPSGIKRVKRMPKSIIMINSKKLTMLLLLELLGMAGGLAKWGLLDINKGAWLVSEYVLSLGNQAAAGKNPDLGRFGFQSSVIQGDQAFQLLRLGGLGGAAANLYFAGAVFLLRI